MPPHLANIDGTDYIRVSTNMPDIDRNDIRYGHAFDNDQKIDDGFTYVVDINTGGVINCRYCLSFSSPMSASTCEDTIQWIDPGPLKSHAFHRIV